MNGTDPLGLKDELDLGIPGVGRFASTVTGRTGGAVPASDPLRLEYERMGRAYPTAPAGGPLESLRSLFGGPQTQPEIMSRLLKMRPLMQEERAQQQAEQKQRHEEEKQRLDVAKYLFGELDKYRQAPPEQQAILAPAIERMWTFAAPRIGLSMSPEDVRNMLPRPDLDRVVKGMIGVEPLTRDQQTEAQAAFGAAATSDQRVKVAETLTKRWTAQADADLRRLLPVFVQGNGSPGTGLRDRLGLPEGAVMPYQAFLQGMRDLANSDQPGLKELASNRFYRDAFTALMKDEEFLTGMGVQSPKGTYKAQEARGVRAGQIAAETEPKAIAGAAEKAEAVKRGEVRAAGPQLGERLTGILAGRGLTPTTATPAQIEAARVQVEQELKKRQIDVAREQGLNAAEVARRTPTDQLRRLEDMTLAHAQVNEIGRLESKIKLDKLVGYLNPWLNEIMQTGRLGPIPVPEAIAGKLTADETRFLAITMDYADSVLRLRSGAQINEQEFKRMLTFLAHPGVTASTFTARRKLAQDLMRVKTQVVRQALETGGYRVPNLEPPNLAPAETNEPLKRTGPVGKPIP